MPAIFFRLDVAPEIGFGHLRRCVVLAEACQALGLQVGFLIRSHGITRQELSLPGGAQWCEIPWASSPEEDARLTIQQVQAWGCAAGVIDHYRLTEAYQQAIGRAGIRWLQFANPGHTWPISGDLVFDASPGASAETYRARTIQLSPRFLLGPQYALLASSFRAAKPPANRTGVVLTFGGGDDRGATLRALELLDTAGYPGRRMILATSKNPRLPEILHGAQGRAEVEIDNWAPAPLMAGCEAAFCAGGTTLYELACLGLPAFILTIADNQVPGAKAWERAGLGYYLGPQEGLDLGAAARVVQARLADRTWLEAARALGQQQVDGRGAERVASALADFGRGRHR